MTEADERPDEAGCDAGRNSSEAGERFVAIARISRPQGRRGQMVAEILTDFPERFQTLRHAYLETPGQLPEPVEIEEAWAHKGRIVLKLSGIDSIDAASRLRGRHVFVPCEDRTRLGVNRFYDWELIGCRVVVERGGEAREIGTVTAVETTGGTDLLHVERLTPKGERSRAASSDDELLIPLALAICRRIDVERKLIEIDPPEDLLELNL